MNDFLPENYEVPQSPSRFTKFEKDTTTKIRILPSGLEKDAIIFYEYFDVRGDKPKPLRAFKPFEETPGIEEGRSQKEVWAVKVWNYELEVVQILNIPQTTIKKDIMNLYKTEEYGSPTGYDLKITKEGEKLNTKYGVIAMPPKDFNQELLDGKDVEIDWIGFMESKSDIFKKDGE